MERRGGQLPAFSVPEGDCWEGLTKREYIATAALAGLMNIGLIQDPKATAKRAVAYADALLAELEK